MLLMVVAAGCMAQQSMAQSAPDMPGPPTSGVFAAGAAAPSLPELPPSERGATIPVDQASPLRWRGIRPGVEVTSSNGGSGSGAASGLDVRYTRASKAASGVAFALPAGATANAAALELRISASPRQRLLVCFTDASGVVWTMPAISAGPEGLGEVGSAGGSAAGQVGQTTDSPARGELFTLKFQDLKPDRWQNAGKTIPARPDPASFGMLTVLDISGFMGAPEEACRWRLDAVELIGERSEGAPPTGADGAGQGHGHGDGQGDGQGDGKGSAGVEPVKSEAPPTALPQRGAGDSASGPQRPTLGRRDAHALFFEALQRSPQRRSEATGALTAIVDANPDDARSTLLLGLAWLWTASDSSTPEASRIEAIRRATTVLDRAVALDPEDTRIPTWQLSARQRLAIAESRPADALAARDALRALTDADPCFHALSFAIMTWEEPRESAAFTDAVAFARRAMRCSGPDSVSNAPRWPYGVQGFLLTAADLFSRAGDSSAAEEALMVAEAMPGLEAWPHRAQVTDRLATLSQRVAAFGDDDPANDPAFASAAVSSTSCVLCHQVAGAR